MAAPLELLLLSLRLLRFRSHLVGVPWLVGKLLRVLLGLTRETDVELSALDAVTLVSWADDLGLPRHAVLYARAGKMTSAADFCVMTSRATA